LRKGRAIVTNLVLSLLIQHVPVWHRITAFSGDSYVLFGLSTIVFCYGGWPFLRGFISELSSRLSATTYNTLAIPLAAGVAHPWGIPLNPAIGSPLMSLSTIIVAINAELLARTHTLIAPYRCGLPSAPLISHGRRHRPVVFRVLSHRKRIAEPPSDRTFRSRGRSGHLGGAPSALPLV
jgi:hypothetical protein